MIVDTEGNPKAVLLSYEEFEDLMAEKIAGKLAEDLKRVEQVNAEITRAQIQDLREEVLKEDFTITTNPDIRVEPLPDPTEDLD